MSENGMIERVALALRSVQIPIVRGDDMVGVQQIPAFMAERLARAAIEAMREPTPDILFAMSGAEDGEGRRHYERDTPDWDGIWRAAIDEALE